MRTNLMLVIVMFCAGAPFAFAQESKLSEKRKAQLIKRFPKSDANKDGIVSKEEFRGPQRMFDRIDADQNGKLSKEEISAMEERFSGGRRERTRRPQT